MQYTIRWCSGVCTIYRTAANWFAYQYFDPGCLELFIYSKRVARRLAYSYSAFSAQYTPIKGYDRSSAEALQSTEKLRNSVIQRRSIEMVPELEAVVREATMPPDPQTHSWVVSQAGAKINVKADGLYRVARAQLQNAGFDVNSPSTNWRLFKEGVERPLL